MLSRLPSTYPPTLAGANSASLEAVPVFRSPGSGGVYCVTAQAVVPHRAAIQSVKPALVAARCPDCGSTLQRAEGCWLCRSCGYSPCS